MHAASVYLHVCRKDCGAIHKDLATRDGEGHVLVVKSERLCKEHGPGCGENVCKKFELDLPPAALTLAPFTICVEYTRLGRRWYWSTCAS